MNDRNRPIRSKVTRIVTIRSDDDYFKIPAVRTIAVRILIAGLVVGFCLGLVFAFIWG